jgi:hypothetical protein
MKHRATSCETRFCAGQWRPRREQPATGGAGVTVFTTRRGSKSVSTRWWRRRPLNVPLPEQVRVMTAVARHRARRRNCQCRASFTRSPAPEHRQRITGAHNGLETAGAPAGAAACGALGVQRARSMGGQREAALRSESSRSVAAHGTRCRGGHLMVEDGRGVAPTGVGFCRIAAGTMSTSSASAR